MLKSLGLDLTFEGLGLGLCTGTWPRARQKIKIYLPTLDGSSLIH